jgi:hypothetical protein
MGFPSRDFDEAVADVCHGLGSEEQVRGLNALLRSDPAARDEYILRVELHARLASEPDLFVSAAPETSVGLGNVFPLAPARDRWRAAGWAGAVAASLVLVAGAWWGWRVTQRDGRKGATSHAVAMLNGAVDAQWGTGNEAPRVGAPIEPRWLHLKSGMAQVVFYSGARMAIEGPAELQIISPEEASCRAGRLMMEVPPQARGFRVSTPEVDVVDLGTVFGLHVREGATELQVFKGSVEIAATAGGAKQRVGEAAGAVVERSGPVRLMAANAAGFTPLFELQEKSVAAESLRYDHWHAASRRLNDDPTLLAHFDFEHAAPSDWRLHNASRARGAVADGTVVGCQWVEGRWPSKSALEFRGVSDRVRLSVPGEFTSLTLATWVRVQGLDRKFNSIFMCDGFEAGTLHWLIRDDGVLGLTVIGPDPGTHQIVPSPPVLTLDQFGLWVHLAVVLDGGSQRVSHYVNGRLVGGKRLKIGPPFRIGAAELGNWTGRGFPDTDPAMIRNFSGAMDEFCLFSRALSPSEIQALHASDEPRPGSGAARSR